MVKKLDATKFPSLIQRIIQKIGIKDEKPFSSQEMEKLQEIFGITENDLNLVLDSCALIFERAAYFALSSPRFGKELEAIGFEEAQISPFLKVWEAEKERVLIKLREKTVVPDVVDSVGWRLHLKLAQNGGKEFKEPRAIFEIGIKNTDDKENKKLQVEFDHQELFKFFNDLEVIQDQLDNLG